MPRTSLSSATSPAERLRQRLAGALPEPVVDAIQSLRGRPRPEVITLGELDGKLAQAAELFASSEDAARRFLQSFRLALPAGRPADPFTDQYREWVWDLYRQVSGRPSYSLANEASSFDLEEAVATPYPYSTRSTTVVGEELMGRGFLIAALGLVPPARIVEFGSGWGNLTLDLAAIGFSVTAVEVEAKFCALTERRCRHRDRVSIVHAGMLEFEPEEPFDAAIFYESFHHCADHLAMLERLQRIVRPGGSVLWAA